MPVSKTAENMRKNILNTAAGAPREKSKKQPCPWGWKKLKQ